MFLHLSVFRIARGSGYKSTELNELSDGSTLRVGGKELEVIKSFKQF